MQNNFNQLKESFNIEVLKLERIKGRYEEKKKSLENTLLRLEKNEEKSEIFRNVNLLFEKASVISRKRIKDEIEILVTKGLQSVFEDPSIIFKVEFISRRNQIEADFYLERTNSKVGRIKGDITETFGGGITDIISTVLRLVVLELSNISGPLFLDEPGKMISEQYVANFGKFLVELSKLFERQIILITHNQELAEYGNKMFNVKLNERNESVVEES